MLFLLLLLAAIEEDAVGANTKEPGCRNFHVFLGDPEDSIVGIYEVYKDRAAFQEHLNSPHYKSFRKAVGELGEPYRELILHNVESKSLLPADKNWR